MTVTLSKMQKEAQACEWHVLNNVKTGNASFQKNNEHLT